MKFPRSHEPLAGLGAAVLCALAMAATLVGSSFAAGPATEFTLRQLTQAMADAVAPGDREVWKRFTDPALRYVTEDNEVKSRAQFLAALDPLPEGSSGHITIQEFRATDFGAFAVATYVQDEQETVEGHELHARYRSTDTWRRTPAGWRLVAAEVFAVPFDPPAGATVISKLGDYEGKYRLSAKTTQVIRRDGDHLIVERGERPPLALHVESGDVFFTPGRPRTRRVFQRDGGGTVIGFADRREGVDLNWEKELP